MHGLWEGIISLPPPPRPPFDIETIEPFEEEGQQAWEPPQLPLSHGRVLILDAEPLPDDGLPVYQAG